jgi:hypothetical protein
VSWIVEWIAQDAIHEGQRGFARRRAAKLAKAAEPLLAGDRIWLVKQARTGPHALFLSVLTVVVTLGWTSPLFAVGIAFVAGAGVAAGLVILVPGLLTVAVATGLIMLLYPPIGIIVTDRRLLLTRNARFTKALKRVEVDVPHELVEVGSTGMDSLLRLTFEPVVGRPPLRLLCGDAHVVPERLSRT